MSLLRPIARNRATCRTTPDGAPSSATAPTMLTNATVANRTPLPDAPSPRATTTASTNPSTPDAAAPHKLSAPPLASRTRSPRCSLSPAGRLIVSLIPPRFGKRHGYDASRPRFE